MMMAMVMFQMIVPLYSREVIYLNLDETSSARDKTVKNALVEKSILQPEEPLMLDAADIRSLASSGGSSLDWMRKNTGKRKEIDSTMNEYDLREDHHHHHHHHHDHHHHHHQQKEMLHVLSSSQQEATSFARPRMMTITMEHVVLGRRFGPFSMVSSGEIDNKEISERMKEGCFRSHLLNHFEDFDSQIERIHGIMAQILSGGPDLANSKAKHTNAVFEVENITEKDNSWNVFSIFNNWKNKLRCMGTPEGECLQSIGSRPNHFSDVQGLPIKHEPGVKDSSRVWEFSFGNFIPSWIHQEPIHGTSLGSNKQIALGVHQESSHRAWFPKWECAQFHSNMLLLVAIGATVGAIWMLVLLHLSHAWSRWLDYCLASERYYLFLDPDMDEAEETSDAKKCDTKMCTIIYSDEKSKS